MHPHNLRAFRICHRLTQAELAALLGIGRQSIVAMEAGRQAIPAWMGLALAAYAENIDPFQAPEPEIERAQRTRRVESGAGDAYARPRHAKEDIDRDHITGSGSYIGG